MKQANIIKLFNITRQTWTNWKKEKKPIVHLIEKYFTDKDIEEFIKTGKCTKFDLIENSPNINTNNICINDKLFQEIDTLTNKYNISINTFIETILIKELSNGKRI